MPPLQKTRLLSAVRQYTRGRSQAFQPRYAFLVGEASVLHEVFEVGKQNPIDRETLHEHLYIGVLGCDGMGDRATGSRPQPIVLLHQIQIVSCRNA
jgi:hypothetical protein